MAAPVGGNELARRVVDDLIDFSSQTSVNGYMNFFKARQIAKAHRFAFDDPGEVFDILMGLRDDVRVENAKLMGLNEMVTQAEEEIKMKEAQLEVVSKCYASLSSSEVVYFATWYVYFEELDVYVTAGSLAKIKGPYLFLFIYKLSEVAESSRLADKMNKKRRLVAELEAVGEVEGAAKSLEHMRVVVACDVVTLGELETLLARAQVGVSLKAGFVADMEVKD
ncbi:hypothetical protein Tco_0127357 [Tanacetum coccineum]